MVYAIVPLSSYSEQNSALRKKIEGLSSGESNTQAHPPILHVYKDYAPKIYFVTYQGTARELSDLIGYGNDSEIGVGLVMHLGNNFGYASSTLWEWMEVHGGKK